MWKLAHQNVPELAESLGRLLQVIQYDSIHEYNTEHTYLYINNEYVKAVSEMK